MKLCRDCGNEVGPKPLDAFYRSNSSPDGRQTYCKPCHERRNIAWAEANPTRRAEASRRAAIKRKYGITTEERDALLAEQGGVCAVCGTGEPRGRWAKWLVDHCHDSLVVRGILCNDCNAGIGILGDSPERLRAAADYIERSQRSENGPV